MPPALSRSTTKSCRRCSIRSRGSRRGAPQARLDCADNLVARWALQYGDAERAFAQAAHRIAQRFRIHKGGGHAIETRAVLARFDAAEDLLTVWDGTQMPHKAKRVIVETLGLRRKPGARDRAACRRRLRAEEPVLSGGAGGAGGGALLGAPVKWVEDRRESFTADNHEREQDWDLEAAVDTDGRLLAVRGRVCSRPRLGDAVGPVDAAELRHELPRALCAAGAAHRLLRAA